MVQLVKCLQCRHKAMSSIPSLQPGVVVTSVISELGELRWEDARTHWQETDTQNQTESS